MAEILETDPAIAPPTREADAAGDEQVAAGLVWGRRLRRLARRCRTPGMILLSLALGLSIWSLLSRFVFNPFLIPPPGKVLETAVPMALSGELGINIMASISRVAVGFLSGSVVAVLAGLAMGRLRLVNELFDPIIEFMRFLSPTAMIPIAVIWFGIGESSKYFLIFWGTVFIVLINTIAGVVRTPLPRQNAALCFGASQFQIFRLIVLPSAVPYIVTGMRVALASSYMSIIPAELLAANRGLGYLLQSSSLMLQTDRIFVALITISLVGFLSDRLFRLLVSTLGRRYVAVT
jgi:ABC-type nitrate/sulfonate/bicarbonate transport system permease component